MRESLTYSMNPGDTIEFLRSIITVLDGIGERGKIIKPLASTVSGADTILLFPHCLQLKN